jgi:hypothetical protein
MRGVIKKEILKDLNSVIEIIRNKEVKDSEELSKLSNQSTTLVATYKDLDLISITVLIYSLSKTVQSLSDEDYKDFLTEIQRTYKYLQQGNFGYYNKSVKSLFNIIKRSSDQVKTHLEDVMHAARIKKGAILLQKGLSLGQAAGLMGLSNWDLQQYAGRTTSLSFKTTISAKARLSTAFDVFDTKKVDSKEKCLFFDAGPIISLVMSRLIWILPKLKEKYGGKFYITPGVKTELVERPLGIKRFEFEALQVMKLIKDGVLEVYDKVPITKVKRLKELANSSFKVRRKKMDIIQLGEMEAIVCAQQENADAIVMDERTLRLFIEDNRQMEKLLEFRFKNDVEPNRVNMDLFSKQLQDVKIIRSIELAAVAYKLGILEDYAPETKDGKAILLDSILWATKYNGAAVTTEEINEMKTFLLN